MTTDTLAATLEHEHREIDSGIEEFMAARSSSAAQAEPLQQAMSALRRHIFLEEQFCFRHCATAVWWLRSS